MQLVAIRFLGYRISFKETFARMAEADGNARDVSNPVLGRARGRLSFRVAWTGRGPGGVLRHSDFRLLSNEFKCDSGRIAQPCNHIERRKRIAS